MKEIWRNDEKYPETFIGPRKVSYYKTKWKPDEEKFISRISKFLKRRSLSSLILWRSHFWDVGVFNIWYPSYSKLTAGKFMFAIRDQYHKDPK